jgi:hypothetical protein
MWVHISLENCIKTLTALSGLQKWEKAMPEVARHPCFPDII